MQVPTFAVVLVQGYGQRAYCQQGMGIGASDGAGTLRGHAERPTPGQIVRLRAYENRPKSAPSRTLSIAGTL